MRGIAFSGKQADLINEFNINKHNNMARKFHTTVLLSNQTAIEFDTFATSKIEANKSILSRFSDHVILAIRSLYHEP